MKTHHIKSLRCFRNRSKSYLIIIFLVLSFYQTKVTTNPLPRPLDPGPEGGPLPAVYPPYRELNNSVFLKTEVIKVTFEKNLAQISALYVLKNSLDIKNTIEILLPFSDKPLDVNLMVNEKEWNYNWISINNLEIPDSYPLNLSVHSLSRKFDSITFLLEFASLEEIGILISYKRNSGEYHVKYDDNEVFMFKYLIGTARWWNHTINSAYFEIRIRPNSCNRLNIFTSDQNGNSISCVFSDSVINNYRTLSVNYSNWIPKDDFLVFSWEKDRLFFETPIGKWILLSGFMAVIGGILTIFYLKNRIKKR